VHADAWGPSDHARHILGYILSDLSDLGDDVVRPDYSKLIEALKPWALCRPMSQSGRFIMPTRLRTMTLVQTQWRHSSAPGTEGQQLKLNNKEQIISESLVEIINWYELTHLPDLIIMYDDYQLQICSFSESGTIR
jgi:hypothetical protein